MVLGDLAESVNWAFGLILDPDEVTAQAVAAARMYHGYGDLRSIAGQSAEVVSEDTDLSPGEWAAIKPLFMLYIERENARALEASRGQGVDVYGRTISEVSPEIAQYENTDLPRLAFSCMPESI